MKQAVGSSPCIRGIPYSSSGLLGRVRLIPVHTGNTLRVTATGSAVAAHPRAYGEYAAPSFSRRSPGGSSPCIRGIQSERTFSAICVRLIPVHTGNTFSSSLRMRKATAHPRAYGEYRTASIRHKLPCGSSPCIRGIRAVRRRWRGRSRLIPVHTGNTFFLQVPFTLHPAHPRAYGEYTTGITGIDCHAGSSPCIRGIPAMNQAAEGAVRLIPVHTGNTGIPVQSPKPPTAHPRAYGEYPTRKHTSATLRGSSPCIRGIL